jgi:hypothetical protein
MPVPLWPDFLAGTRDPRFLVPISRFSLTVDFVRLQLQPDAAREVSRLIINHFVQVVSSIPGALSALDVPDFADRPGIYAAIDFGLPVYGFGLVFTSQQFSIRRSSVTPDDLLQTIPLLQQLCDRILNPARPDSIVTLLDMTDRIHTWNFEFFLDIHLGKRLLDPSSDVTHDELYAKMVSFGLPPGVNPELRAPLSALSPEEILRGDLTVSFDKTLNGYKRHMWFEYAGYYNYTKRDIDIKVSYRNPSSSEWNTPDLFDWETVMVSFYRDLILNQLLFNLLYGVAFSAS